MEIKQLKYFLEVAKREHLSDAALELDIAQSAISRQIQQLEDELQVKLFKRQGRNIRLT
ncbi:LysR family transcriptional regulator, partial [Staphylococcus warneri]